MKINSLITNDDLIFRVLDIQDTRVCIIDCVKKSVPNADTLLAFRPCPEECLPPMDDLQTLRMERRKCAHEKFTLISCVLSFITDKQKRCSIISQIASEKDVSMPTIQQYLWQYQKLNPSSLHAIFPLHSKCPRLSGSLEPQHNHRDNKPYRPHL